MIIVRISGGLGNQLFQYAFGQYLAKTLNTDVKYDLRLNIHTKDFTPRNFELKYFNIEIDHALECEIKKMKYFSTGFAERIERKLVNLFPFLNRHFIIESPAFSLKKIRILNNSYYDGYWQYYDYPSQIRELLINNLIPVNLDIIVKDYCLVSSNVQNVSIHIRRGDYITNVANHAIFSHCEMSYYQQSIEILNKRFGNLQYFVFSDDIEWVKLQFKGSEYVFVEGNSPSQDLFLMSRCNHHIIANSTFSWWAAWLNRNDDKVIIAPKNWFRGRMNQNLNKLLPFEWIKI